MSRLRRLTLALLAVVQVGAPALATVAHAQLARATTVGVVPVHVEEPGHRHAVPGHPESCVLCQVLGRTLAVPVEPAALSAGSSPESARSSNRNEAPARAPSACLRTRAPPASV